MIAKKFVSWNVTPLKSLSDSFPYQMMVKLQGGDKLTHEEKDRLMEFTENSRIGGHYYLLGWFFDFRPYFLRIWAKTEHGILEIYAPDKTAVRKYYGKGIIEMYCVPHEPAPLVAQFDEAELLTSEGVLK